MQGTPAFYLKQPEDTIKGQMYYYIRLSKLHSLGFNVVIKSATYQGDVTVWHTGGKNTWDFGKDAGGILILR